MKNTTNTVRTLCEIGIFAALGFIIDELQGLFFGSVFPNGGSIGFAMIAVLIIAYRRGLFPALLTGLVMGLFDIATKAYVIHPMQVLLDYILPYVLVGFAGLFKPLFDNAKNKETKILWLLIGTTVGGLLKFVSHYLAGVVFWADPEWFAWGLNEMSPYLYCFIYNIAFVGPSIVLTGALLVAIFLTAPRILTNKPLVESKLQEKGNSKLPIIISSVLLTVGTFLFVFFFIKWINSFYYKSESQKYYFDQDSMVIYVIGIYFMILGGICLSAYLKKKFNYLLLSSALLVVTLFSFLYSINKIVSTTLDKGDPKTYWIWFAVSIVGFIGATIFFVLTLIKIRREKKAKD